MVTVTGIMTDLAKERLIDMFNGGSSVIPDNIGIGKDDAITDEDPTWITIPNLAYQKNISNKERVDSTTIIFKTSLKGEDIPEDAYNILGVFDGDDLLFVAYLDTAIEINEFKYIDIEYKVEW